MEFTIKSGSPEKQRSACVVVGVFDNRKLSLSAELVDRASNGYVSEIIRRGDMEGKLGATLLLHNVRGTLADRVLLVGLGKERDFRDREFRKAIRSAVKLLNETGSYEAVVYLTEEKVKRREVAWRVEHAVIVAMESVYRFEQLKSQPTEVRRPLRKLTLSVPQRSDLTAGEKSAARGLAIAHGMELARDLGNLPGNICTPTYLAERARQLAVEFPDISVKVLERSDCEELGMGSFLSVTNGSEQPPRFIVFEYMHSARKQAKPCVLIGKGITFDTGGISLKPGLDMDQMKFDMCGAASSLRHTAGHRRAEGAGQRGRSRAGLREHAVGPCDQARRRRDQHVRPDHRSPQHRCRRTAGPCRRPHLRRALRAGGGRRHRHADRRDGDCARPRRDRAVQQQRGARAGAARRRATTPTTVPGSCRCGRSTRKVFQLQFRRFRQHRGCAPAAASPRPVFFPDSPRSSTGRTWTSPGPRGRTARTRARPGDRCRCSRRGCWRRSPRRRDAVRPHDDHRLLHPCRRPPDGGGAAGGEGGGGAWQRARPDAGCRDDRRARSAAVDRSADRIPAALPARQVAHAADTPVWIDHRLEHDGPCCRAGQSACRPAAVLQPLRAPGRDRRRR